MQRSVQPMTGFAVPNPPIRAIQSSQVSALNFVTTIKIEGAQTKVITKSLAFEVEGDASIFAADFSDAQGLDSKALIGGICVQVEQISLPNCSTDFTPFEEKLDSSNVQVPLPPNPVDGSLDQDFGAIPKLEDLAGMRPRAFIEIDNLVEICNTREAESTGEV